MTIASEITRINDNISAAYTVCNNKGATMPVTQNSANLASCINTITSGSSAIIDPITINPSTSSQTITASGNVNGYSPITVNAVTSSIDQNIIASNIKKDVTILNVTGTFEGITPSGILSITANGTYDVTNYASANVSVPGSTNIPSYRIINNRIRRNAYTLTGNEFNYATRINDYGLAYSFYMFDGLTGTLNLSTITNIGQHGMEYTCSDCTGLTSVDLSSLTDIDVFGLHESFYHCASLTSANLSSVINVAQSGLAGVFSSCNKLTTIDVSSISSVGSSGMSAAFSGCSKLKTINLTSLTTISSSALSSAFAYCTALEDVYFNSLTTTSFGSYVNQFSSLLSNTSNTVTHTLHFPSNLQSTISSLTGYPLFSGTSGYVTLAFDLPATS